MANCPHCKKSLSTVTLEPVDINVNPLAGKGGPYVGIAYVCPSCRSALSVSLDPLAIKLDTLAEIRKLLGRS
jgi:hypothetical protein